MSSRNDCTIRAQCVRRIPDTPFDPNDAPYVPPPPTPAPKVTAYDVIRGIALGLGGQLILGPDGKPLEPVTDGQRYVTHKVFLSTLMGPTAVELPTAGTILLDSTLVVRGGANATTEAQIATHPSGVTGLSVESANGRTLEELAGSPITSKYGQIRCCTVGQVRAVGGDVIPTRGQSPFHGTLTGLTPETINEIFGAFFKNPSRR